MFSYVAAGDPKLDARYCYGVWDLFAAGEVPFRAKQKSFSRVVRTLQGYELHEATDLLLRAIYGLTGPNTCLTIGTKGEYLFGMVSERLAFAITWTIADV